MYTVHQYSQLPKKFKVYSTCIKCDNEIYFSDYNTSQKTLQKNELNDIITCSNCHKQYTLRINFNDLDFNVEIPELEEKHKIYLVSYDDDDDDEIDDYISNIIELESSLDTLKSGLYDLKELNNLNILSITQKRVLKRLIYTSTITHLEEYLSTTLIKNIFADDKRFFMNFIKNYKGIKNQKFELSEIFDKLELLDNIVKKELKDIIYHDLSKIKEIYKFTFDIDFPKINNIMPYVIKRHDMVHRNGKTKQGNEISLTTEEIDNTIIDIQNFAIEIDKKIAKTWKSEEEYNNLLLPF